MRDRCRALALALRLAGRAGGGRLGIVAACSLALALQPPAAALAFAVLADGTLGGDRDAVVTGASLLALLTVVTFSAYGIRVPLETTITERATQMFERDLMDLMASVPTLEAHERPDVADRLEVLRGNVQAMVGAVWAVLSDLAFLVGAGASLVLLARADLVLLGLLLAGLPMLGASVAGARLRDRALDTTAEPWREVDNLFDVATTPRFAKDLRLLRLRAEVLDRHERRAASASAALFRADLTATAMSAAAWVVLVGGWVTAVAWTARRAVRGEASLGDVVLVVLVAGLLQGYVAGATNLVRDLMHQLGIGARYVWLVEHAAAQQVRGGGPAPDRLRQGIVLENVSFTYPGTTTPVLHGVSGTIPAGAAVGVVGANGAGKSTLVKLLLGLYRPTEGRILVDGEDLAEIDPQRWRLRTSGAFQDFARLEFVLRESVGLGDLEQMADGDLVAAALDRAGAQSLPPLEQQLGREWENGVDLSGGQWQQVALGRAAMREHPLLRVLDEPTASLHAEAEQALFDRYLGVARAGAADSGAVTLLVSHRFAAVRGADIVVVVHEGRVEEQGSHAELLAAGGHYAEMFRVQADEHR